MSKKKKEDDLSLLLHEQGIDRDSDRRLHRQRVMQQFGSKFLEGVVKGKKYPKSVYGELKQNSGINVSEVSGRKTPDDRGELDTEKQTNEDFAAEVVERLCRGKGFKSFLQAAFADVGLTFEIRAAEPVISDAHTPSVGKGADEKPKWKDRLEADRRSPAEFIRDTYGFKDENGTWHHAGLRQSDLRGDPELYAAYATWKKRHSGDALEFAPPERTPGGKRVEDAQEAIEQRRSREREAQARYREKERLKRNPAP